LIGDENISSVVQSIKKDFEQYDEEDEFDEEIEEDKVLNEEEFD